MLSVGHVRQHFAFGVALLIRRVLPAIISLVVLYLIMALYGVPVSQAYVALMIVTGLLAFILFPPIETGGFYFSQTFWTRAVSTSVSWMTLFAILLFLGYVTKSSAIYSRRLLITWFVLAPLMILAGRLAISYLIFRLTASTKSDRRAVIVGVNSMSQSLMHKILETPNFGVAIDGFFDDRSRERLGVEGDCEILGGLADLPGYVLKNETKVIFISVPIKNVKRVTDLLNELHDTTVSIYYVPDIFVFDLIQCRTIDIEGIPAVALCETPFYGYRGIAKRTSDIIVALMALIVASPIMILSALLIKVTSKGSIIFKQRRYGLDGHEIVVYKFRSMTVSEDTGEIRQAEKDDQRLTPIGAFLRRYSIDELPQFVNVLQGRMSVVGPRPHAVAHNEEYRRVIKGYMIRHKVAPGITGLAQVSGYRGETETVEKMQRRIELDLEYLRKWSLGLDVRIILQTVAQVFTDKAAY